ncbi:MAG: hypothetical protein PHW69_01920 [Elusimicrobiaceae bacterium]|nr:hypothetical protein [Elusimicrobiaceae bacterium]
MGLVIVVLLALCAPGAGQIYNGDYGKAVFFGGVFLALQPVAAPLAVRFFKIRLLKNVIVAAQWINSLFIALVILSVFDAFFSAYRLYSSFSAISWAGLAYGAVYAMGAVFCYKRLMASPYPDMLAGLDGFVSIIRPESKKGGI